MWKIYQTNQLNLTETLQSIDDWKHSVFNQMDIKVKKFFAEKMVSHFDNRMIFQNTKSAKENLMEALSDSEKQMSLAYILFPPIKFYWMPSDEDDSFVISHGLPDEEIFLPEPKHNLELVNGNPSFQAERIHEIENKAWSTLVFDISLCNYSKGWINYIPSFEDRCLVQSKVILMNTLLKNKEDCSLLEKVEMEETITEHASFNQLHDKIVRLMPKINKALTEEWRNAVVSGAVSNFKKM